MVGGCPGSGNCPPLLGAASVRAKGTMEALREPCGGEVEGFHQHLRWAWPACGECTPCLSRNPRGAGGYGHRRHQLLFTNGNGKLSSSPPPPPYPRQETKPKYTEMEISLRPDITSTSLSSSPRKGDPQRQPASIRSGQGQCKGPFHWSALSPRAGVFLYRWVSPAKVR